MSKTRVASIAEKKCLTIPRLELMGVVIACRILQTMRVALQITETAPVIVWIDAKCVLYRIRTTNKVPTFVKNRVSEIRKTPNVKFRFVPGKMNIADLPTLRFVPGKMNIADLPTRTCSSLDLLNNEIWWRAPCWIRQPENYWPPDQPASANDIDPESSDADNKTIALLAVETKKSSTPLNIDASEYHSYEKLINTCNGPLCSLRVAQYSRLS